MKNRGYNLFLFTVVFSVLAVCLGCAVGIITTPRDSEGYREAEFKLAETSGDILVLVRQFPWLKAPVDIRLPLTKAINRSLVDKVGIDSGRVVLYSDIAQKRKSLPIASSQEPLDFAAAFGVEYLLVVDIDDFALSTFAERDFFTGSMRVSARLFDSSGAKLWPVSEDARVTIVSIDSEKGTVASSVKLLSSAAAHCITRYLYNCKNQRFRIPQEQRKETYAW